MAVLQNRQWSVCHGSRRFYKGGCYDTFQTEEPAWEQGEGHDSACRLLPSFLQQAWTQSFPFTLYFWRWLLTWAAPRCEFIGSSRSCCCSTWSSQVISSAIASRDESFSIWSWGKAYNESSTLCLLEIPRKMTFLFLERLRHYNRITGAWTWKWALCSRGANDFSSRIHESEITFFLIVTDFHAKL